MAMASSGDRNVAAQPDARRGRQATGPFKIDFGGWVDIGYRVYTAFTRDRVMLVAAGAAFYLLLALFPALTVLVSSYGFVADRGAIIQELQLLTGVLPGDALELIRAQLQSLADQDPSTLSIGFLTGFLIALWSANNGVKTLFEAVNIAYDEREKRSFIRLNLIAFVFTLGAIMVAIAFVFSIGVMPAVLGLVGLDQQTELVLTLARWPVLFVIAAIAISLLYRYGPSREHARWRWVTPGGIFATIVWLVVSSLFSWYLGNFANYNATYGSLGAIVGFMMWTWVSMLVLIVGAELNAEMEHQTLRDSTTGPEEPMGERGATMADTIGQSRPGAPDPTPPGPTETPDGRGPKDKPLEGKDDGKPENPREPNSGVRILKTRTAGSVLAVVAPVAALGVGWLASRVRR